MPKPKQEDLVFARFGPDKAIEVAQSVNGDTRYVKVTPRKATILAADLLNLAIEATRGDREAMLKDKP